MTRLPEPSVLTLAILWKRSKPWSVTSVDASNWSSMPKSVTEPLFLYIWNRCSHLLVWPLIGDRLDVRAPLPLPATQLPVVFDQAAASSIIRTLVLSADSPSVMPNEVVVSQLVMSPSM